jgi:ribosomal protein S12 methylthiotransferase
VDDVVREAEALAARGVRELVLVAQDSTRYGLELGLRHGLAVLLQQLGRVDGIKWIRVMYAYPSTVTDPILEAIASEEKVVKYIDIPLQHASEPVLRRMKRPTGRGNLLGLVEKMRERVPGLTLRTSFIVGFPGETDDDFAQLLQFVDAARFDNVGVFTYSDEEDTASFDLDGRVPQATKEARKRKLMSLQKKISTRRNKARVGERLEVLVEGLHEETDFLLKGRTAGQAPEIDGQVYLSLAEGSPESLRAPRGGDLVRARVTGFADYDVAAEVVEVVAKSRLPRRPRALPVLRA